MKFWIIGNKLADGAIKSGASVTSYGPEPFKPSLIVDGKLLKGGGPLGRQNRIDKNGGM